MRKWPLTVYGRIHAVFFDQGGETTVINILTGFSAMCTVGTQFITSFRQMIFLECLVAVVATVATIQSCYYLIITVIEVHTRRSRKKTNNSN